MVGGKLSFSIESLVGIVEEKSALNAKKLNENPEIDRPTAAADFGGRVALSSIDSDEVALASASLAEERSETWRRLQSALMGGNVGGDVAVPSMLSPYDSYFTLAMQKHQQAAVAQHLLLSVASGAPGSFVESLAPPAMTSAGHWLSFLQKTSGVSRSFGRFLSNDQLVGHSQSSTSSAPHLQAGGFFFRKPKRIRTAFSPGQLLHLEHSFDRNHYVVGAERKDLAKSLGLSETQVKVWFQNRRTKHKRYKTDEEARRKFSISTKADAAIIPGSSRRKLLGINEGVGEIKVDPTFCEEDTKDSDLDSQPSSVSIIVQ